MILPFAKNTSHKPIKIAKVNNLIPKVENIGNFSLEETRGQPWKLFLSPVNTAIANCVSCDFQMDKGIAKQFLKQYGNFNELIEKGIVFYIYMCNRLYGLLLKSTIAETITCRDAIAFFFGEGGSPKNRRFS